MDYNLSSNSTVKSELHKWIKAWNIKIFSPVTDVLSQFINVTRIILTSPQGNGINMRSQMIQMMIGFANVCNMPLQM